MDAIASGANVSPIIYNVSPARTPALLFLCPQGLLLTIAVCVWRIQPPHHLQDPTAKAKAEVAKVKQAKKKAEAAAKEKEKSEAEAKEKAEAEAKESAKAEAKEKAEAEAKAKAEAEAETQAKAKAAAAATPKGPARTAVIKGDVGQRVMVEGKGEVW